MNGSSLEAACFDLYDYTEFFRAIRSVTETRRHRELKFSISEDVIELLIRPLYGRQDSLKAAVRELLKNALDACRMKKKEKEERGEKKSGAEITVRLEKGGGGSVPGDPRQWDRHGRRGRPIPFSHSGEDQQKEQEAGNRGEIRDRRPVCFSSG